MDVNFAGFLWVSGFGVLCVYRFSVGDLFKAIAEKTTTVPTSARGQRNDWLRKIREPVFF